MPSRASTSFLPSLTVPSIVSSLFVSMPSRASTSFLQYPFKNLGFMRFPEPVFAGICQNILTIAHFYACSQFGHIYKVLFDLSIPSWDLFVIHFFFYIFVSICATSDTRQAKKNRPLDLPFLFSDT